MVLRQAAPELEAIAQSDEYKHACAETFGTYLEWCTEYMRDKSNIDCSSFGCPQPDSPQDQQGTLDYFECCMSRVRKRAGSMCLKDPADRQKCLTKDKIQLPYFQVLHFSASTQFPILHTTPRPVPSPPHRLSAPSPSP